MLHNEPLSVQNAITRLELKARLSGAQATVGRLSFQFLEQPGHIVA